MIVLMMMEETLELSGLFYRLSGQDLGDSFPEFVVQEEAGRQVISENNLR
jgi:hypothetical protein